VKLPAAPSPPVRTSTDEEPNARAEPPAEPIPAASPPKFETARKSTLSQFPAIDLPGAAHAPVRGQSERGTDAPTSPEAELREFHASVAPLWRRALAFAVDGATISGIAAAYLWVASTVAGASGSAARLSGLDRWAARAQALQPIIIPGVLLGVVIAIAYSAAFAVLMNGRTFGRLMAGIRLVDRTGLPPSPTRAVIRALLAGVSFALFLGGFWLALFDRRGQTLHDKLTSTFVVRPV